LRGLDLTAGTGVVDGDRPEQLPGDRAKWKPPKVAEVVDRRVVVNPRRARELLTAVTYVGRPWRGRHLRAFFACMYFAALRPGEVKALRKDGCFLLASGWGRLTLSRSRPQSNRRWTDSGEAFDDRGLKHRAEEDTRPAPIPPELVTILREHIEEFGTAADGRLFRTATGGMICDTTHTWAVARTLALVPEQVASPLAGRPYDLRHGAVSLCLNGGVATTEVANRAGHSVEVLLRVYAKCIDGGEEAANRRIDEALAA
jgi:integrase